MYSVPSGGTWGCRMRALSIICSLLPTLSRALLVPSQPTALNPDRSHQIKTMLLYPSVILYNPQLSIRLQPLSTGSFRMSGQLWETLQYGHLMSS